MVAIVKILVWSALRSVRFCKEPKATEISHMTRSPSLKMMYKCFAIKQLEYPKHELKSNSRQRPDHEASALPKEQQAAKEG